MNKICCIYNYFEKNEMYRDNMLYFMKNNGFLDFIDYYIVINGKYTIEFPKASNVFIYERENKGLDFGAYSYIVSKKMKKNYDYYFFINSSVRGPYLDKKYTNWSVPFLELFNDSENIKIVGTTINIHHGMCHVQGMFFCLTQDYFLKLRDEFHFFSDENILNQINSIFYNAYCKEITLSVFGLRNGYNINCILPKYRGLDYRMINKNIDPHTDRYGGDVYFPNAYFGGTIKPNDVIFFKTNRFRSDFL